MKEKITFYKQEFSTRDLSYGVTAQYVSSTKICEVIMPVKDEWDWQLVFDKLTNDQLKEIKEAFIKLYNQDEDDEEYKISMEDIEDNDDFEEYLADYHEIEYSGFCDYSDYTDYNDEPQKGLTIRELYVIAEKTGILDKPITISYSCNDSWYSFEDKPLTKDCISSNDNSVNFWLDEESE